MSALGQSVEDYLSIRRALGYKLVDEGRVLSGFAAFVDQAGAVTVTTDLAVAWAMRTQHSSARWCGAPPGNGGSSTPARSARCAPTELHGRSPRSRRSWDVGSGAKVVGRRERCG